MPETRGGMHPGADLAAADPAGHQPCRSPVFVLSASRSGSTLMRFLLDTHPDLACPPETGVTTACTWLLSRWDTLENAAADEHTGTGAATQPGSPGVRLPYGAVARSSAAHLALCELDAVCTGSAGKQ